MSNIVTAAAFNPKKITISPLKTLQSGAKQGYLNYGGDKLMMQTARKLKVPFGLNVFSAPNAPPQYSLSVSLNGADSNAELKQFLDAMQLLDEAMIEEGVKNSKSWFRGDMSKEVIRAFYQPCVKIGKDKEGNPYPPNMKIKLRQMDGQFTAKFFDANQQQYNMRDHQIEDLIAKGALITVIMECTGVWVAATQFGLTWVAKQVLIHEAPKKTADFAFVGFDTPAASEASSSGDDSKSNEIEDDAAFAPAAASKPSVLAAVLPQPAVTAASAAESSSVNDADGDDIEPIPAPKKVISKKIIKK